MRYASDSHESDEMCSCGKRRKSLGRCQCQSQVEPEPEPVATPIYALGRLETRFPTLGFRQEFICRLNTLKPGGGDPLDETILPRDEPRSTIAHVLKVFPHLARSIHFYISVDEELCYWFQPTDQKMLDQVIEALALMDHPDAQVAAIGTKTPNAGVLTELGTSAQVLACSLIEPFSIFGCHNGIIDPDSLYAMFRNALIAACSNENDCSSLDSPSKFAEILHRIVGVPGNIGDQPEHRALNYLALHYPGAYLLAAHSAAIETQLLRKGPRSVVQISFIHETKSVIGTVKIDVTDEWPFLSGQPRWLRQADPFTMALPSALPTARTNGSAASFTLPRGAMPSFDWRTAK